MLKKERKKNKKTKWGMPGDAEKNLDGKVRHLPAAYIRFPCRWTESIVSNCPQIYKPGFTDFMWELARYATFNK